MNAKLKTLMLKTLVDVCETVKAHQKDDGKIVDNEGRFATGPQAMGYYYATLYTYEHPDNPYHHDADILARAEKCWDYHTGLMNDEGKVAFYTYDQYWSTNYDTWTTLHLLNSIELLRGHLPGDKLAAYENKMELAVRGIKARVDEIYTGEAYRQNLQKHELWNIFLWMVALLTRYALLKDDAALLAYCDGIMNEICAWQLPFGTWLEGGSLVVAYAHTTLGGLSLYAHYRQNQNTAVNEAVLRNIDYLLACYYKGTLPINCFDIRSRAAKSAGQPFIPGSFVGTPNGLSFCSRHARDLWTHRAGMTDHLLLLLFFTAGFSTVTEDVAMAPEYPAPDGITYIDKLEQPIESYSPETLNTLVMRKHGFAVPVCLLTSKSQNERFHFHRQNLFSVYHEKAGIIIGGGHSTAMPEFSTCNVIADGLSRYLHTAGKFTGDGRFSLWYGKNRCDIAIDIGKDAVKVHYQAHFEGEEGEVERVIINVPIFSRHTEFIRAAGPVGEVCVDTGKLDYCGLRLDPQSIIATDAADITCDRVATLKYPVFAFNTYMKDQQPAIENAFMILSCDLDYIRHDMNLVIRMRD